MCRRITNGPTLRRSLSAVTGGRAGRFACVFFPVWVGCDDDHPDEWIRSERVILKIAPDNQILFARGVHDIRR